MKYLSLIAALLLIGSGVFAQATGNHNHGRGDYISKSGVPLYVADPEFINHWPEPEPTPEPEPIQQVRTQYVAVLTIAQQASTAGLAEQQLHQRLQRFYRALASIGIPRAQVGEEFTNLHPTYRMDVVPQGHTPIAKRVHTGFELKKTIRVTFYDYNLLETILIRAADLEIFQLDQVEHLLGNS